LFKNSKKFSVVIPTKNRINDLKKNINSIVIQHEKPSELLIVDQSDKNNLNILKKTIQNKVKLRYFHKKNIQSLTEAKNFSLSHIQNDIIFFLEDDIILKKNFFKVILDFFEKRKDILGVCGILVNERKINYISRLYNFLFLNGIYKDIRPSLWNNISTQQFIYSNKISGGISAWRKKVFKKLIFDKNNKLHLFEDVDFSVRVNKIWPDSTGIITLAKVVHKWSHVNRSKDLKLIELKIIEAYKFCKKNSNKKINLELFIYIFGIFLSCLLKSILLLNLSFLKICVKTVFDLRKIKIYLK
jgi:glycosyltransferase involved in cell wall biosynthesis